MGCGGSKLEDDYQHQTLVKLCRERKHLLKSAADHRFSLAAAHVAYFAHLSSVGDTLWRFVEEELVLVTSSPSSSSSISSLSSPVLTIPSDDFKKKKKPPSKAEDHGGDNDHDHLHWSSSGEDEHVEHGHQHGHRKKAAAAAEGGGKEKKGRSRGGVEPSSLPPPQPGISYIPDPGPPPPYYSFDPSTSYGYPSANAYGDYGNYGNAGFSGNFSNYGNNSGFNAYSNPNYPPQYGTGGYYSGNYDYDNYNNDSSNTGTGTGTSYGFGSNTGNGTTYTSYYMKKSSTRIPSVFYEQPKHVNNPIYSYNDGSQNVVNHREDRQQQQQQQQMKARPPTPPSPKVSAWDYFNPFESFESGGVGVGVGVGGGGFYGGEQQPGMYGYGGGVGEYESNSSSPDSREVREREGIPDLEEETETEVSFPMSNTKKVAPQKGNKTVHFQDHVHEIPLKNKGSRGNTNTNNVRNVSSNTDNFHEGSSKRRPFVEQEPELEVVDEEREVEGSSFSPETEASVGTLSSSGEDHEHDYFHEHELEEEKKQERVYLKKKGVSFEVEGSVGPSHEVQSSMPSSLTTLSADGTRDLREVVREIKDEFEAATDYGKEVSTLLEVGREPYRSRSTFLKVMLAKMCSTSLSSFHSPSGATGYPEELNSRSLASTLDKLYVWEKKLYKEVKDEEKLRLMYEKQCKKLKTLDEQGAETSKIEATQFSIRKLLTKINVSVRAVDFISNRIHKLRDEELQPQLKELVYGLRKMWKLMLKCHQKQFQAILESKTRALRANTGLRKDSSVRATIQLEAELLKWGQHFNNWIEMQRSYAKTLNRWLERCIQYEPEETADGVMPFSPGRIGAPPVFVICHDWKQAMERVSESQVQTAMNDFASSLHQLWERQDEEQRRRLKADNIYTDFEKQIRAIRVERQRKGHEHDDALSDKNSLSIVASDSGISPLDDLKVDLDSMRQRVREERAGHKEAIKLVHDAVSRSIQAGLIPIFESLESFTSDASKALDDVRLEHVTVS
ncbi:uncharacterized protein LOC141597067 isoform X2 [Silene latifolia]|uniref:uncharacterized protein LOC141597067 isoform X2 n=1 Tax=Silene latifolia TaxID=37657 RepID=UPI003D789647